MKNRTCEIENVKSLEIIAQSADRLLPNKIDKIKYLEKNRIWFSANSWKTSGTIVYHIYLIETVVDLFYRS